MKKYMLLTTGLLYAGFSLANSSPNYFTTNDWRLITPSYTTSTPNNMLCEQGGSIYICNGVGNGGEDGTVYQMQPTFRLTNDPSQYCTYNITATWSAATLTYNYDTQLIQTTSGINCDKTSVGNPPTWYVNPA